MVPTVPPTPPTAPPVWAKAAAAESVSALIAISLLIYHQVNVSHFDLWPILFYGVVLGFLATRARALKSRVAELVDLAAFRAGLQRVSRKGKPVASKAEPELGVAVNATDPASPQLP